MARLLGGLLMICGFMAAGCTHTVKEVSPANDSKYRVSFNMPKSQKWDLVSVEQDAGGYAKSYRSTTAKGLAATQSFYINYGHNIKTPLLASMNEVESSIAATECSSKQTQVLRHDADSLIFTVSASRCSNGQALWQVFKVFNMPDGQYSIVYTANPNVVSATDRQQMKAVVTHAKIALL